MTRAEKRAARQAQKDLRKAVKEKIVKLGKDGKLTQRDIKKISKTSGGGLANNRIGGMIKRISGRKDFEVTDKSNRVTRKFNVEPTYAMDLGELPGNNYGTPGTNKSYSPYVSAPGTIPPQDDQATGLSTNTADYAKQFANMRTEFEKKLEEMRNSLSSQMNPQMRNPVFGVRNSSLGRSPNSTTSSFGRGGGRLGGIRNTALNVS